MITVNEFTELVNLLDKNAEISLDNTPLYFNAFQYECEKVICFHSKEILDHPECYKLLEVLNKYTPNIRKNVTTMLRHLDKPCEELLNKDYAFGLSITSLDVNERVKFSYGKDPELDIRNIKEFLVKFKNQFTAISVLFTGDLTSFKKTIDFVRDNMREKDTYLNIHRLTTTKYTTDKKIVEMSEIANTNFDLAIDCAVESFKNKNNFIFAYGSLRIPQYRERILNKFDKSMDTVLSNIIKKGISPKDVGFVTTEMLVDIAKINYPKLNWITLKNEYFGGNIFAYALFTFEDVLSAIKNYPYKWYALSKSILCPGTDFDLLGNKTQENFIFDL